MNKVFILVVPKRTLFTPPQIERLAEIFLEIGKLITAGVVIGRFIPSSGVSTAQFWVGLITACICFAASVLFSRGDRNGH